MLASLSSWKDAEPEGRQGLGNLLASWTVLFAVVGIPAIMLPVLYAGIVGDTGWSRGAVAAGISVRFATGAVAAFFIGAIIDRFGTKPTVILLSVLGGTALILFFFVHGLAEFYVVNALLGVSQLGLAPALKIYLSKWFNKHQGLAIGTALTALSVAGVVVPLLVTALNAHYGWRATAMVMSLPIWVGALPAFLFLAKDKSTQAAYGTLGSNYTLEERSGHGVVARLMKSRIFWIVLLSNFLIGMIDHAMSEHLVIYFDKDLHFGAQIAATAFTLLMLASNFGKFFYGWLFDRYSTRGIAICWFIAAAGIVYATRIHGTTSLWIFALIYGPCQAGMLLNMAILCKHFFGPHALAKSISVISGVYYLGGAVGPGFAGYMFDVTGSYHSAFLIVAATAVVAGLLVLSLGGFKKFQAVPSEAAV
jgi:MFS transporter, OFA family, oxalate/formate antiporter